MSTKKKVTAKKPAISTVRNIDQEWPPGVTSIEMFDSGQVNVNLSSGNIVELPPNDIAPLKAILDQLAKD